MVGLGTPTLLDDGGGSGGDGGGGFGGLVALIDVLGKPAEALTVALPLEHAAHEHLQWSCIQVLHWNVALVGDGGGNTSYLPELSVKPHCNATVFFFLWQHSTFNNEC